LKVAAGKKTPSLLELLLRSCKKESIEDRPKGNKLCWKALAEKMNGFRENNLSMHACLQVSYLPAKSSKQPVAEKTS
jgi:hypothetical protein